MAPVAGCSCVAAEVVLTTLIRKFKFSMSDKEIYWNLAGVCFPTTEIDSIDTSLPLVVEAL